MNCIVKYFVVFIAFFFPACADEGKFILLFGPSGAGKSTIIRHLKEMDSRFVYISPYTTRELRLGETDKIHANLETIQQLDEEGKLLTVNLIYGIYYATPKDVIDQALANGMFPVLDWPIASMDVILKNYSSNLFTAYIEPESLEVLKERLGRDGRDKEGKRFMAAKNELERYYHGEFDELIDMKVLNLQDCDLEAAVKIYQNILR